MASRLPLVATEVEGVRELLGPQADLQTVAYGDSAQLTQHILQALTDSQQAAAWAEVNRRRVEEYFTLDRMVATYQDLWDSLLS